MQKRTPEEIKTQIEGLKKERKNIPEYSHFGDNNWTQIDAKLDILEGKSTVDDFKDDEVEEDDDLDMDVIYQSAQEADDWLDGITNDDLFDEMWANQK